MTMADGIKPDLAALAEIAAMHARLVHLGRSELDIAIALMGSASAIFCRLKGEAFLRALYESELRRLRAAADEELRARTRAWAAWNLETLDTAGKA